MSLYMFLSLKFQCLLFWMLLLHDIESDSEVFLICILYLTIHLSYFITAEYTCLTFVKIASHVKISRWLSVSILMTWFIFICQRCTLHCSFIFSCIFKTRTFDFDLITELFIYMLVIMLNLFDFLMKCISSYFSDANVASWFFLIFYFFIKCMKSMTMTLSRCCAYVRLHISWSKSLLYIFSLINHINSLCKQAFSIKQLLSLMLSFSCFFMFFSLYSFVLNSHFLVAIQVLFKYFNIVIFSTLMINNINIMFMFLNCAFALSCNCSAL